MAAASLISSKPGTNSRIRAEPFEVMQQRFDFGGDAAEPLVAIEAGGRSIRIGCCGFSYAEWVGSFYPAGLKQRDMLAFYAKRFDSLEIDAAYYGVPKPVTFERLLTLTPDDFRIAMKLPGR